MAISLALIILLGLIADYLFRRAKLPGLLGILIVGILLGPYVFNLIDPAILTVSADFRMIALIVILLRAGLATKKDTLNRVGKTAVLMGFLPALFEGTMIAFAAPHFFDMPLIESAILGFIVAAVSPAIVVPMMLRLMETGRGTKKDIPTLLLASASLDNVFAIVLASALISARQGKGGSFFMKLLDVPVSICLGVAAGIILGFLLHYLFNMHQPRATKKGMIVIGAAILLTWLEKSLKPFVALSALSGVMAIGFIILKKSEPIAHKISQKLGKIWVFAEILLFVLVGAQVNINVALDAGLAGSAIIFLGLIARSIGAYAALAGTGFNMKEKLFCTVSYIPKATVQAAIGAVPLSIGIASGEIILAVAVLSILITSPLGAIAMNIVGEKALEK